MASYLRVRQRIPPIDWRGVPLTWHNRVSAVCRTQDEANDLVKWFGAVDFCPLLPVLLLVPGTGGVLLCGLGYATAAELRDDAVAVWVKNSEKIAKSGSIFDFDELREKHGLIEKAKVKTAMSEAFWERIQRHRASPVTDPFRQPQYPRVNGKTVHAVAKVEEAV